MGDRKEMGEGGGGGKAWLDQQRLASCQIMPQTAVDARWEGVKIDRMSRRCAHACLELRSANARPHSCSVIGTGGPASFECPPFPPPPGERERERGGGGGGGC